MVYTDSTITELGTLRSEAFYSRHNSIVGKGSRWQDRLAHEFPALGGNLPPWAFVHLEEESTFAPTNR